MKTYADLWQNLAYFFLEWDVFQTRIVQKIKTHILCAIVFIPKMVRLLDYVEKFFLCYNVPLCIHYQSGIFFY
jgi:hypothetical protein